MVYYQCNNKVKSGFLLPCLTRFILILVFVKVIVIIRFIKISLIFIMLFTHAAEAFVVVPLPCAQMHEMMDDSNNMQYQNSNGIDQLKSAKVTYLGEVSDNCCQQECACAAGLMLVAALINPTLIVNFSAKSSAPKHFDDTPINLVLNQIQKPPKATSSL